MTQATSQSEQVGKLLKLEGWSLSKEVWSSLCNTSRQPTDKMLLECRETLLYMDLQRVGQGIIKLGLQKKQLEPPLVLQVLERRNITIPRQKIVKLEEERNELARNNIDNSHQWILRVSDGETILTAVEDESLVELHQNWRPGIKIVIVQTLAIFHGVIFVTRRDIKVLGGGFGTSAVEEKERKSNGIQSALEGPPLFQPFDSSKRKSDDLRFAGFDIDAFVLHGELRTIHRTRRDKQPETLAAVKQEQEHVVSVDEKAKNAMLQFLWNLQGKKQPQKPVKHKQIVDSSAVVAKQKESQMSVERGIQRLTNTLQEFTIKSESQRAAQQTDKANEREAEEIMRSFYSSRQENSIHSKTHRGRGGSRGRARGRRNAKGGGRQPRP
ncbi:hypothetical protein GpartN1_g1047.t1 [Galdieria partita]|uniref:RecQ-mediated genome instability protein 1 n=1 Tax=Galdieria partita TaxID=83374 RepID=A0A9C7PSY9_9RHOD|nr:hypothetical protein GpartN1_g1047.t1 [Galdieria partita]